MKKTDRKNNVEHADVLRAFVSLEDSINEQSKPKKLILNKISKWSLRFSIGVFVLFFLFLMWEVWRPGSGLNKLLIMASLLVSMLSFLIFELAFVYDLIRAGIREKSYTILASVKDNINFNEKVVFRLAGVPTEALILLKNDLIQECERRDINSYFYLGAVTKLGILPSIYSIYLAYKNVFDKNEITVGDVIEFNYVAQLYVLLMAIVVAIYAGTSIAKAACNKMKRMIYWIDRALAMRQENEA